jgi:hypothetical protein
MADSEKGERSEGETTKDFQEKFLSRLAEKSFITRGKLDELVAQYGFKYIQANTLYVHKNGFKHFGSDLLRAYRENPARFVLPRDVCFKVMHDALKG